MQLSAEPAAFWLFNYSNGVNLLYSDEKTPIKSVDTTNNKNLTNKSPENAFRFE